MKLVALAARWASRFVAAAALVVVASCGGGMQADVAPTAAQAAALPGAPAKQALAAAALTPAQLMDWAEGHYSDLFPAAGKSDNYVAPYTYRYYPLTGNFVAVSTGAADVAVYVYGNVSAWQLKRIAPLADFTCVVFPLNCGSAALSPNIAVWGDSLISPFAAHLQLLFPDRVVYDGNGIGQTSTQVAARLIADTSRHAWITVFWAGHNNDTAPEQIKADIAASIAALAPGNSRFVIMSLLNKASPYVPSELKGTPGYQTIVQLDAELGALYPDNYLDIRSYLVSQYDPTQAQDVIDFQNDVVPSSLRYDDIHLKDRGSELVANKVQEFINAHGW